MQYVKYIVLALTVFFIVSCKQTDDDATGDPLAKFKDEYIYFDDIKNYLPEVYIDSNEAVTEYLESLLTKRLLTELAKDNLSSEIEEINELVENYKNALLINSYLEYYVSENLDTNIPETEIEKYYEMFRADFSLEFNAVKGLFIVVPKTAPDVYKVRNWYRSDKEDNIKKLDIYCNQYAVEYNDFNDDFVVFDILLDEMPTEINDQEMYLRYNKSIEASDSLNYYYLKISDYKLKNDTAPLVFVRDIIKDIVINKTKMNLIKQLENDMFQDALNRKEVEIYN